MALDGQIIDGEYYAMTLEQVALLADKGIPVSDMLRAMAEKLRELT